MSEKYKKTNLYIVDAGLWQWAKYQAALKGYGSVSEYVFELIKKAKEKEE